MHGGREAGFFVDCVTCLTFQVTPLTCFIHSSRIRSAIVSACLISFGSNLGDRRSLLAAAADKLRRADGIASLKCSRLFETPPVGGPSGQEPFLNAAAVIETSLRTDEVLQLLQATENELGRFRKQRWGERTIDLDVVLYGTFVGDSFRLKLPHLRYTARTFVLAPAQDVASHWQDPRFGWTLKQLSDHLQIGPPSLTLVGGGTELRQEICQRAAAAYDLVYIQDEVLNDQQLAGGWISDSIPAELRQPYSPDLSLNPKMPRLIARLQKREPQNSWPAPQLIYRNGWNWPEYQLETDDIDWAVGEAAAAIASMRCDVQPITADDDWSFEHTR